MSIATATVAPAATTSTGLPAYTGDWTHAQAAHLLRRTVLGPKRQEIWDAANSGLAATLDQLFEQPTLPSPPLNHFATDDPNVPVGSTWVNSPHVAGVDVGQYRWPSLRGWYFQTLFDAPCNITEKLTLFWLNHFGMSDVGEHRAQYQYLQLFREIGLGSFQTMIERITVHPAMLRFLNGDYSTKWNPNENYARELLELFTVQKGDQIGPGDYSNYTEQDIQVAARVLTGWRNRGMWSQEDVPVESYWHENWHHDGTDPNTGIVLGKQLSYHFNNEVIPNLGDQEYKYLINIIFQQPETARAICREFYRYFVHYEIDAAVESTVIEPLSQFMIANDFSVEMTLRNLFESAFFYEMAVRGPIIKNPYEFVISITRPMGGYSHLGLSLQDGSTDLLQTKYDVGTSYHWWTNTMDMDFLYPPTVAGWPAYYQTPGFYRNWIGSATLQRRRKMINDMTNRGIWTRSEHDNDGDGNLDYEPRPFDWFGFINSLADGNPYDVNDVVDECVTIFLPREIDPAQFDALKEILTGGINDQEWTLQYGDYRANPNNPDITGPLENKIKQFFRALFSMAEFHLQ